MQINICVMWTEGMFVRFPILPKPAIGALTAYSHPLPRHVHSAHRLKPNRHQMMILDDSLPNNAPPLLKPS